eukprot:c24211_g1_i1 orf=757-4551(-)
MEPANEREKKQGKEKEKENVGFRQLYASSDSFDVLLIVLGTFGALLAGAPLPVIAFLFGKVLDDVNAGPDLRTQQKRMSETAIHALITGFVAAAGYLLQVTCWMSVGERQAERIRYLYLQALLRQDLSFYDQEVTTGAVAEGITADTFHIKQATGEKVGKLVQVLGTLLSGYAIAFSQGWKLTLVGSAIIPFILISSYAMDFAVSKTSSMVFVANGNAGCIVEQVITAIKTVVPFGGEKKAVQAYNSALRTADMASLQECTASGVGMGMIMFCTYGVYASTLWFGAQFIVHGDYTGGRVMTVLFSIIIGTGALGQCTPSLSAIASGRGAAHKMFQVIHRVPGVDISDESGHVLNGMKGDIEFKNVRFAYPTRPEYRVFTDFSMMVPAGTTAALVGESGSGKSTIVSLIERFYDPAGGEVRIDGLNLKDLKLSWFRRQVGLVAQEPVLLRGSIRENIAYGKEGATEEEIGAAAELANAANFIARLPEGMETIVGQRGLQLSGGQKQRIAIARAVVKNPRILLLDEATSSLDVESEAVVHRKLERAMEGCTILIIAHRLTTVKDAHFIAVLQHGSIVEQGSYAKLLNKPEGVFAQLVSLEDRLRKEQQVQEVLLEARACGTGNTAFSGFCASTQQTPTSSASSSSLSSGSLGSTESFSPEIDKQEQVNYQQGGVESDTPGSSVSCSHVLRLAAFNKPETPLLLLGSLAAIANGAFMPIVGLLYSNIIHTFYKPRDEMCSSVMLWIYFFITLGALSLVLIPLQNVCFSVAGEKLVRRIRLLTFDNILHQEIKWFEDSENASGLISSRLQWDAAQMRAIVGDAVSTIVQNMTTIVVGLFIAMSTCWQLALLFVGLLPFYSLDGFMQVKLGEVFDAKAKEMYEETSQIAHEALSSIRTVASFCAEKKVLSLYRAKSMDCLKGGLRQAFVGGFGLGAAYVLMFGSLAISLWAGGKLLLAGEVDFNGFVKTFLTIELSAFAIALSLSVAPDISNVKLAITSVFNMLDLTQKDLKSGTKLKRLKGEVEFRHVQFSYPTRPDAQIFGDLSFTLHAGETLALVGESGCGKSTVLALVQRFYDPDVGAIFLDKVDMRQLQIKWLRRQMGLVSQEPFLFNDTIRANIEYGVKGEVTEEALQRAAEVVNADKFIAGLPRGYESVVGERGVQLSGGQKQRVAIARAIVRDPRILLLDEATSALDAKAEVVVEEALERAAAGRSTMVVAHRLSTVRNAHLIVVLKSGQVAELGTHDQLMAIERGQYASLVRISTSSTVN